MVHPAVRTTGPLQNTTLFFLTISLVLFSILPNEMDLSICSNLTQLDCVYSQQSYFHPDIEYSEQCPLECDTITYDVQMPSLAYTSNSV